MIRIENVYKSFGKTEAVKGINLQVKQGELFGLLGPNGAGKTTTINLLNTLLKPDAGRITLDDLDVMTSPLEVKKRIGVIPQEIALYGDLSAYENLLFWAKAHRLSSSEARRNAENVLDLIGLKNRAGDKIKNYSGGMKRRVNIGAGLIHKPKIVLMDEPTVGIDPQSRNQIYEIIGKLKAQDITIIYTTHYMEEAEKLCDRIAIIDHGEIIAKGTLQELKKLDKSSEAIVFSIANLGEFSESDFNKLHPAPYIQEDKLIFLTEDADHELPSIIRKLEAFDLKIDMIDFKTTNLETLFLNLTGRTLRE